MKQSNQQIKEELESLLKYLNFNTKELDMETISLQFISVILSYERKRNEITNNSKNLLTNVFNDLPSDIKDRIKNKIGNNLK